jgi:hypothetical protein
LACVTDPANRDWRGWERIIIVERTVVVVFVVYKGVSEFGFVAAVEAFGEDGSSEETSEPE